MEHRDRNRLLALLTCLLAAPTGIGQQLAPGDPAAAGLKADCLARIDAMAAGYVRRGAMPGVLIVIARHGRVAHTYSVGSRHVETGAPMAPDTVFRIYSMTKPVTGVAVLQLLDRGLIHLSDPVARFLPQFAGLEVWVGGSTAAPQTTPARAMTIEHLLTHTSGLTYEDRSVDGPPALYAASDLYSVPDLDAFVRKLARLPLASQPGTRWEYSVSMDVLGRIVEVVSGRPFDTYLQEEIFQPLGMVDTGFRVPDEKVSRFAALYARRDDGGLRLIETPDDSEYRTQQPVPFGGHGLVSTAADYLRFAQMLINGGELDGVRILSTASVDLMLSDHLGPEYGPQPLTSSWLGDAARGLGFGLTGAVVRDGAANGIPGSTDAFFWGGAASTFFWVDRARDLVGLQFTQLMPSNAYPIREEFRRLTYEALAEKETR